VRKCWLLEHDDDVKKKIIFNKNREDNRKSVKVCIDMKHKLAFIFTNLRGKEVEVSF
jgi:hypothetical protein